MWPKHRLRVSRPIPSPRILVLACVAVLSSMQVSGQSQDPFSLSGGASSLGMSDIFKLKPDLKKKELSQVSPGAVPMDAPLNPAEYYVGPNDILALNIWSSAPVEYNLTVTPEATLIIPNLGIVNVKDVNLEAAKKKVSELAEKKYLRSQISLTLIAPRKVSVKIVGEVLNEGTYEMQSVQRSNHLIALANTWVKEQQLVVRPASERNILIRRSDGSTVGVDLVKYDVYHDGRYNPYLREGDIVYVPGKVYAKKAIAIYGAANKFGNFEYVVGDSLTDLIRMGFGLNTSADSAHARFSRLSIDGNSMDTTDVDLRALIEGRVPNIALRPGDRLFVPEIRDARKDYYIAVEGQVVQPGNYPITQNRTKLSEVIRAAGGFTGQAFLQGAMLIRSRRAPVLLPDEIWEEELLSRRSNVTGPDSSYFFVETALRVRGEPVSVDFYKLFVLGDSTQDVILRSYDRVVVPEQLHTVYVFGQVKSPGHVPFVEEKGYRYYIEKAGGYTDNARSGDTKIIKGSTRAWLDPGETRVEDGDLIWVPKDISYPFSHYLNTYVQIASIVGVVATVALLINTVK